jgi:hypothetical protein
MGNGYKSEAAHHADALTALIVENLGATDDGLAGVSLVAFARTRPKAAAFIAALHSYYKNKPEPRIGDRSYPAWFGCIQTAVEVFMSTSGDADAPEILSAALDSDLNTGMSSDIRCLLIEHLRRRTARKERTVPPLLAYLSSEEFKDEPTHLQEQVINYAGNVLGEVSD